MFDTVSTEAAWAAEAERDAYYASLKPAPSREPAPDPAPSKSTAEIYGDDDIPF